MASAGQPPTLVTASRIITMADQPYVYAARPALAIQGERVVGVGDLGDLRRRMPDASLIDFGEASIAPGFNDAHQHPTMTAANQRGVDLSAAGSRTVLLDELRSRACDTPSGEWVLGTRYDHGKSTGGTPLSRTDLDEVTETHPVLLINIGAHWGVLNSAGLAAAGLSDDSVPPPGGELSRDAAGHLTGVVHEQALFDLAYPSLARGRPVLPVQDTETALVQLRRSLRALNAAGITSVGDAMVGPTELALLQEARQRGELTARVNALLTFRHFDAFLAAGLRTGFGDHWLRVGGVKAFADGAVAGGTCLVEEPFEGTDDHGIQTLSTDELNELALRVHAAGSRLAIHANGDRAIKLVLTALEQARAAHPVITTAHRLEHCSLVDAEILARMKNLGAVAVPFGSYVAFHGDKLVDYYGVERLERMFAHRSFLEAGVPVAGSSDFPCGPFEPLLGLASCVTRVSSIGRTAGQILGPSQRISAQEALAIYTTGSAYAAGEAAVKGRLVTGNLADFVVLSDDPLAIDPRHLPEIHVHQTWVGGRPVWRDEDPP
ncbi:amidohydrolase [Saccharopolyspora sp. K220]|uniref:amidohydrolase n=1 Tax=Saccharopolyspora soli TaxID=2926618 RepID=UPI001F59F38E|nr:amidohydrolase [Saccharopolyspora soli]MCI2416660.1 amidohydrolase [Saccharopolyspora soli]